MTGSRLLPVGLLLGTLLFLPPSPGAAQEIATLCDRKGPSDRGNTLSVDVVIFQGPCQKKLVPGKDATVRVYLFWKNLPDRATVERYQVTVTLETGGGQSVPCAHAPGATTILRPDRYADSDRRSARNSVNFFGCDLEGVHELQASVQLHTLDIYGNPSGEAMTYPGSQSVQHMASAQTIRGKVVFPTVGSWSKGVPQSAIASATRVLSEGRTFALQNLPIGEVDLTIASADLEIVEPHLRSDADLDPFEADEEWSVRTEPCAGYAEETCRTFVEADVAFDDEVQPEDWLWSELRSRWDGDAAHLIIAWVPRDFQGGWPGLHRRPRGLSLPAAKNTLDVALRTPAVVFLRADANAATVAHELGHYLGLPHHDGTIVEARTREVEGFRSTSSTGVNKSYVEGNGEDPSRLFSLMVDGRPGEDAPELNFIMNPQYEVLVNDLEDDPLPSLAFADWIDDARPVRLASTSPMGFGPPSPVPPDPTVVVRGVVTPDGTTGRLRALEWVPGAPSGGSESTGVARVRFVDGDGGTLSEVPVGEDLSAITNNEVLDEGAIRFALRLSQPAGAEALQLVSGSGAVLAEVAAHGASPSVRILAPADGEDWAPGTPLRWETSDPEGGRVVSSVYYSPDGGRDWTPITVRARATSVTPLRLRPGPEPVLIVAATDGFSVTTDTLRLGVRMPVEVVGAHPGEAATVGPGASVQVRFTSEIPEDALQRGVVQLLGPSGSPVAAETACTDGGAAVELVPRQPLERGVAYTVRIPAALEDRWGNQAETETSWTFTVEPDRDPPRVDWIVPGDGAIAVPRTFSVRIRFSEALDPATLDGIRIEEADGDTVPADLSWDAGSATVQVLPERPLDRSTTYRVTVPGTVADPAGNRMAASESWSFTTR